ncbi:hypothetical protein [Marinomonas sp. S3726]|uniref:hypothetical protein n=1 Tax=Marinomonas sp. S3726 TaxID=579484 RepID=UPI000B262E84|nr:hypothetical protein [Marinomonas sp. S3726]
MKAKYCKYIKMSEFSLWIDIEQPYRNDEFLEILSSNSNIEVIDSKIIHSSIGPLEHTQTVITSLGEFTIVQAFEGFEEDCGTTIFSNKADLMKIVFSTLDAAGT